MAGRAFGTGFCFGFHARMYTNIAVKMETTKEGMRYL